MGQDGLGSEHDGVGPEQARLVHRAMDRAGLELPEVWMHYFSIGGNAGQVEVEAFLHHALPLPALERDMLAHAVNELIDSRPVHHAPYTHDLAEEEGTGSGEASDQGLGEDAEPG